MTQSDMTPAIEPKATELTADHLLGGPRTIRITSVEIKPGTERPVSISFDGDDGLPFKPCKTVCRVLVNAWGPDASKYVGRSITLFRDPTVKWGGLAVGGLRASHLSHIDGSLTMALTMTKGSKKAFTVHPLAADRRSQASDRQPATPTAGDPPLANGGGPVEGSPSAEASAIEAETQSGGAGLAGPDVDILDWAASWNRGLAQLDTVAEVVEAVKAAKAGGYVLKLRGSNPGMAKALMDAADARVGEIEGARE